MSLCDYGCGQEGKYYFKNPKKWCCSKTYISCPGVKVVPWNKGKKLSKETCRKISLSLKGKLNPFYGKKHTKESLKKISEASKRRIVTNEQKQKISLGLKGRKFTKEHILKLKRTISKIKIKYPTFSKVEEMRYNPEKLNEKEIQVHCKNHKCKNSKEQGGWFTPLSRQIEGRISGIEYENDLSYFYCCDKCKNDCPLFNFQVKINKLYTNEEYQIWRVTVLERENYICEYCDEKATDVHHSRPKKLEPGFVLDPDFGVACCEKHHYKYGHKIGTECSTGKLAAKVC